jgi:hypothetical protein
VDPGGERHQRAPAEHLPGSPGEGWAVGGIEHLRIARAVHGLQGRPTRPVAAGRDGPTCVILHYHNGRWSPVSCPFDHPLQAVSVLPDGEAWAVGAGVIPHEAGGVWRREATPRVQLHAVAMLSADDGWAAGLTGGDPPLPPGDVDAAAERHRRGGDGHLDAVRDGRLDGRGATAAALGRRGLAPALDRSAADTLLDVAAGPGDGDGWIVGAGSGSRR